MSKLQMFQWDDSYNNTIRLMTNPNIRCRFTVIDWSIVCTIITFENGTEYPLKRGDWIILHEDGLFYEGLKYLL